MNKAVRAKILTLSGRILMGKADRAEIEQVGRAAKNAGESAFFWQEIKDCDRIIRERSES